MYVCGCMDVARVFCRWWGEWWAGGCVTHSISGQMVGRCKNTLSLSTHYHCVDITLCNKIDRDIEREKYINRREERKREKARREIVKDGDREHITLLLSQNTPHYVIIIITSIIIIPPLSRAQHKRNDTDKSSFYSFP